MIKIPFSNYLFAGLLCFFVNACGSNSSNDILGSDLETVDPVDSLSVIPSNSEITTIDDTSWILDSVQLNDGGIIVVAQEDPGFTFGLDFTGDSTTEISDGIVIGSIDCNGFNANYQLIDSILSLENILTTDAECEDVSSVGGIIFRTLFLSPSSAEFNADSLIITSGSNESLIYVPSDQAFVETNGSSPLGIELSGAADRFWLLTDIGDPDGLSSFQFSQEDFFVTAFVLDQILSTK